MSGEYLKADNERDKYLAFKQFKEKVAAMHTDEDLFASLELDLDRFCDGVMSKLKSQVPSIKGDNRKMIALFFAGIPYNTVQLIMNKVSVDSLKTARYRFRKEIKNANAKDEQLFLRLLEIKNR